MTIQTEIEPESIPTTVARPDLVKALLIGNSKSGKTGSLVSLVKAGYKLRVLDIDNLIDILRYMIQHECPENQGNLTSKALRDRYEYGPMGHVIKGRPKAWPTAAKMCEHWKDDNIDLGPPGEWGPSCILVIDSLSRLCDAAYDYHESIIPIGKTGDYDQRAIYGNAQSAIIKLIAGVTSDFFQTNVLITAHISYQEQLDKTIKGFPQGVGNKLSPKIPQYFPNVFLYTNKNGVRTIQTNNSSLIDLSSTKPMEVNPTYPITTGLASIFEVLRGPLLKPRPKSLTIRKV